MNVKSYEIADGYQTISYFKNDNCIWFNQKDHIGNT